ncbi:MAG: CPBP family intramembrane metalloprotease [Deltaproteobacteria bacterium]|nr:CPBP family intramembrane metalloprotease [Deltaproteobacteria bacterium]
MTIPIEPRTPRLYHGGVGSAAPVTFTALGGFAVVCAATATMLVGAVISTSAGAPLMVTAMISQLAMLAVPIAATRWTGLSLAAIGLARPAAGRFVAAAVLIGASAWYLNMRLVSVLPVPHEDDQLLALIDRPSLVVVLLAVAVAPAICEEVLFRGVLARAFASRFALPLAVVLAALVFAGYHFRVVQLLPTFTLGLGLGWLAIRARSAVPGMLAHLLNNAIALVVARDEVPAISSALASHPTVALVGFAILTVLGLALIGGRRQ